MDFNATLIGQTIAMIVFVWFCMKYIWPPMIKAIEERRENIADGIAASEKAHRDLAAAQTNADTMITDARSRAQQIIDHAEHRGAAIVEEAKKTARTEGERIKESAQAEIVQERNRARDELRGEVVSIAVAGASKLLEKEIDSKAHGELLDKLVAEI